MKTNIEPITLTVTLTGRKAAAYRRMCLRDGTTEQESADEAVSSYLAAFTEMESAERKERKDKRAGIVPKQLVSDEFVDRLADRIADNLVAGGVA
ncbi:MAG: hypothetical protein EOP83_12445 [Verrucomicrobiaceae bacterium]|nr:MAG: hypothetical protein EOP83_12445 [Verrucomicrobiaceae bacterium]